MKKHVDLEGKTRSDVHVGGRRRWGAMERSEDVKTERREEERAHG